MTYSKLPGVYFTEVTEANADYDGTNIPLFIVQTSTAIASIDDQITHYTAYTDFKTVANNKGLPKSLKYIEDILIEGEVSEFYVYSIKTDTATGFTNAIKSTAHLDEVTSITYIEETASSTHTLASKIGAIKSGLADNAANGVFREGYIIPYGTVSAAVTAASSTPAETTVVTTMTTITTGNGDGRICMIVPDTLAGTIVGKCIAAEYNEEPGYTPVGLLDLTGIYKFDATQMLTLQNLGVMFVKQEKVQGVTEYRINLGVTTSFKESKADGLLVCRTIADELLRQIGFEAQAFIKAKESASTLAELNTVVSTIINNFVTNEDVVSAGTSLKARDAGNSTFIVEGTIQPTKSVIAIEVNTVLQA